MVSLVSRGRVVGPTRCDWTRLGHGYGATLGGLGRAGQSGKKHVRKDGSLEVGPCLAGYGLRALQIGSALKMFVNSRVGWDKHSVNDIYIYQRGFT
jgi:hypothetical protein